MSRFAAIFCLLLAILCNECFADQITSLPSLTFTPNFDQYSGYIVLNSTSQKSMFYWFAESQNNPASDPMIIWLQGGPGCSGLIGFFQEHGPFLINTDNELIPNFYSWNKLANIVYVESPVGVGFSYSNDPNDYITNDNETAADNYLFLTLFFQQYPQFSKNDFWITGESYAGVYGPMLANLIVDNTTSQLYQSFKGFSLGNPVTSCPELKLHSMSLQIDTYYYNGLISLSSYRAWQNSGCVSSEISGSNCGQLYLNITSEIGPLEGDDLYNNYCTGNGTLDLYEEVPNCVGLDDRTGLYLNRKDVQAAIFAKPTVWYSCGNPQLKYRLQGQNMMNYYNKFFSVAPSLRIMIYSGDVDISTVPHAFTQICIESLHRPLIQRWSRWTVTGPTVPGSPSAKNITAGYVEVYDRLTFATVKGAGHEAPQYQPASSYNLYERFIIQKK